jgi:hypothetical protein
MWCYRITESIGSFAIVWGGRKALPHTTTIHPSLAGMGAEQH